MRPHGQDDTDRATDAEKRALREIVVRLTTDYPDAALEQVEAIVRSTFQRTSDARVQQYRLVLAERDARVRLRLATRGTSPDQGEPNNDSVAMSLGADRARTAGASRARPSKGLQWTS